MTARPTNVAPAKGWLPLVFLTILTIVILIISVISLYLGWTTIFQNLFYFPIIFACAYYLKRGFVFSVLLASSYVVLMAIFSQDPGILGGALMRLLIFILVAAVITYLSIIRIRAEERLRESEHRLADIIDFLPDPTFAIDADGKVIAWNRAIEEMLGISKADMLGKGDYAYTVPVYGEARPVLINLVLHENKELEKKYTSYTRSGDQLIAEMFEQKLNGGKGEHIWVIASPLYGPGGTITGAIESIRIVTDRKRAEDALQRANQKLNLLSSITRHDINNQLTVLQGYREILETELPDTRFAEYFQKINAAGQRIYAMIQFTREYEQIGVHAPSWQDCRTLADTAAKEAPLGQVMVKNDLPCGAEVFADPLIVKVFYNLMDNAVRYGGKITTIRFSVQESGDTHIIVCEDDGDGVRADEKKKIFERGFGKNTGLGLFLSREILAITGITIQETGEPGTGARFEMTVPKEAYRFEDTT